jgi:hypothetical protein
MVDPTVTQVVNDMVNKVVADWRSRIPDTGYTHVKVISDLGWELPEVKDYFERKFDSTKPHLVVLHRHGKTEKFHFHVQGILKRGITRAKVHKDAHHPAKKRKLKPFQMKREHFEGATANGFMYMLKPQEVRPNRELSDLIVVSSFSDDEHKAIIKDSKEYFLKLKRTLQDVLQHYITKEVCQAEQPKLVKRKLICKAIEFTVERGGTINPFNIRNRVLTAMYVTGLESYKSYVVEQCQ